MTHTRSWNITRMHTRTPNTGTLKLTLGVSENAIPGSTVAFTYKGDEYKATVPYNHIPGQKTITTKIVVNEKQPVIINENKSRNRRQRRGAKRDSMWHGLSSDTNTENHPYWLGRKIRRFFFNQDCSNATTTKQDFFRSEIGVVTGVRSVRARSARISLKSLSSCCYENITSNIQIMSITHL
jgi:hypothetical protein